MQAKKIVLIGAGSRCFGFGQIRDILSTPQLQGRNFTLSLVDEDPTALEQMTGLTEKMKAYTGSDIRLESTTDRRKALPGADYVVVAVARKRYPLWEQDFRIPLSYGFRHCLGENGGPGALFHALRSFELIIPICRDIEQLAPQALLLNFTNPEARVLNAICHLTKVRAAGLCHGVFAAIEKISQCLNMPEDELQVVSAGMNHFYCVLKIINKKTGQDLFPDVLSRMKKEADNLPPLVRKMLEIFDMITYPSDDHIGEYLSYSTEFTGIKWHYGQECKKVSRTHSGVEPQWLEDYVTGKKPLDAEIMKPGNELAVPIICDIELNRGEFRSAVNVLNTEGYIENLPTDSVIEIPAKVDAKGIHPIKVGPIPESVACYIRTQLTIQKFLTEAYHTKSKKMLLRALLMDPCVNSISAAEKMLDEMLSLQSEFLPTFS